MAGLCSDPIVGLQHSTAPNCVGESLSRNVSKAFDHQVLPKSARKLTVLPISLAALRGKIMTRVLGGRRRRGRGD